MSCQDISVATTTTKIEKLLLLLQLLLLLKCITNDEVRASDVQVVCASSMIS